MPAFPPRTIQMAVISGSSREGTTALTALTLGKPCRTISLMAKSKYQSPEESEDGDSACNVHGERPKQAIDEMIFWKAMAELAPGKNPSLLFEQVHQAFVGSYWSSGIVSSVGQYIRIYLWLAPRSRAMNASRDALCLVHLGTRYRDRNLLMEGRQQHLAALRCLGEEIQRPNAVMDDSVLGACYTVAQCEIYRVISQASVGWIGHMPGLTAIFVQRGASSIQSPFAQAVLDNTQRVAVMEGLIKRKKTTFASQVWITRGQRSPRPAVQLTAIALQVSGVLETADRLCAAKGREELETEIVNLLIEMVQIEQQLHAWLLDFYKWLGEDVVPYKEVDVATFSGF